MCTILTCLSNGCLNERLCSKVSKYFELCLIIHEQHNIIVSPITIKVRKHPNVNCKDYAARIMMGHVNLVTK